MLPQPISFTTEEEALVKEIGFDLDTLSPGFHERLQRSCTAGGKLARSLLMRRAIPEIRYRYFTDPELNTGRRRGSRKNNFERNGTKGYQSVTNNAFHTFKQIQALQVSKNSRRR
jgi:hypothetical protein